ncbi:MAG: DNA polymerase III subunit delta [Cyanobacterium sp. T60_A2020_053]|nr:DNA polymerase III subunit delta [Cyanobacterium sp. T60_A2020_053]
MPTYFYWGDDDFAMNQEITQLKSEKIDQNWLQFNFEQLAGDKEDNIREGLMLAMTPPFGAGERLVWLNETNLAHSCSDDLLDLLQKTLPQLPDSSHLLLTSARKPDSRLKSTKLINKYAQVKEFSLIAVWQTEILQKKVAEVAENKGIKLSRGALEILANCVGNDTRLLWQELDKLAIFQGENSQPISAETVSSLVNVSNQNSLQLAQAILKGDTNYALNLVTNLVQTNEPALRIVATLVGQFRTWTIIKTLMEAGEKDEKKIAKIADISNPKRIYFLRQEVQNISAQKLQKTLPILLELDLQLKTGGGALDSLQTAIIQLTNLS